MGNFKKGDHVLVEYESDGKYVVREIASIVGNTALLVDGYYTTKWDLNKLHKLPSTIAKERGL
jgi:hypothetical protein